MWDFLGKLEKDDSEASRLDPKGDNIYRVPCMSKICCCSAYSAILTSTAYALSLPAQMMWESCLI